MKQIIAYFATIFLLCNLSAQKPRPVQIQTIDTSKYVVEYVPIEVAQKNVDAQLAQVNKQIETVEKQMAELVKKRDELKTQQAALEYLSAQLKQAATAPAPPTSVPQSAPQTAPETKKPKKKKN